MLRDSIDGWQGVPMRGLHWRRMILRRVCPVPHLSPGLPPTETAMIRAALLSLALLALPMAGVAAEAVTEAPAAEAPSACDAKPATAPAAEAAAPTDAPVRHAEATPARPASARSPGNVRTTTPRWNRLLPGMFR
jgi:hypothetical protein